MEDRVTTASATTAVHGGMQLGKSNSIIYKNCAFYYITNNYKQCHPAEEHVVSEDTPRDLIRSSSVHTTTRVRLVDRGGRELELGDLVLTPRDNKISIYAGNGMIIGVNEETGKIVHEPINVEEPFRSYPGWSSKYSRILIVQRAKRKVDQKYDYFPMDFVFWCYKGMTFEECFAQRRRKDPKHFATYLKRVDAEY